MDWCALEATAARDWGYAVVALATVSVLLLALRLSGQAFLNLDFEILVIHVPTLVSLIVYARKRCFGGLSGSAAGALPMSPS